MSIRCFLFAVIAIVLSTSWRAGAQTPPVGEAKEYAKARHEFIQLAKAFDRRLWDGASIPVAALTPQDVERLNREDAPTSEEPEISEFAVGLEALLLFEEMHRSEQLGLMALRKIMSTSVFGSPDMEQAKVRAIKRLAHYASLPVTAETLVRLMSAPHDTESLEVLRTIIESPDVSEDVRPVAQLVLSYGILKFENIVKNRTAIEERMWQEKAQGNGKSPTFRLSSDGRGLIMIAESTLKGCPDDKTFAEWEKEAVELLELLQQTASEVHIPVAKSTGPGGYVVSIDPEETLKQSTIAELAVKRLQKKQSDDEARAAAKKNLLFRVPTGPIGRFQ